MYYSNGVSLRSIGAGFNSRTSTPFVVPSPRTTSLSVGLKSRPGTRTNGRQDFPRCEASTTPVEEPVTRDDQSNEVRELSSSAAKQLSRATRALRSYGWLGFWSQLVLGLVSAGVLLFSIAYTAQTAPRAALYLTAIGAAATFISCFQYFAMVMTSRQMKVYLEAPSGASIKQVSKKSVLNLVSQALATSMSGLAVTIVSLQYSVGLLLAKTLSTASVNPFTASAQGTWNPVLAFDVFLLQASSNTILSHTIGAMISIWLLIKLRDRGLWHTLFGTSKSK